MSESVVARIRTRGVAGVGRVLARRTVKLLHNVRTAGAEEYRNPTDGELHSIERALEGLGVAVRDYRIDPESFSRFRQAFAFPADYHGGVKSGVYDEKLLEHFVSWELLGLEAGGRYLDVAGSSSPWVLLLSERGVDAYSVDLVVPNEFQGEPRYIRADATSATFPEAYFDFASAQCAYEMFLGDADVRLLEQMHRVLKPGGRFVIVPLYMHTHYCFYQTPDYWGKPYGDPGAKGYIRRDCIGIPASRKYSPQVLKDRVLDKASSLGFRSQLYVLRNKREVSPQIYCHFILVLEKPDVPIATSEHLQ